MGQTILQKFFKEQECDSAFDVRAKEVLDNSELRAEYKTILEIFSGKRVLQVLRIQKN